ncbi:MAG: hypothetical protein KQJ78_24380 [Deltaproteobacteria bacterium]|nr:hypothetical protein [Deltaproteobacteria bacterium]
MPTIRVQELRRFYTDALLCPELMCLCCSRHSFQEGSGCRQSGREDCLWVARHMVGRLGLAGFKARFGTAPPPSRP